MSTDNCGTCRYWQKAPGLVAKSGQGEGDCRRNPPFSHLIQDREGRPGVISQYSKTKEAMWCGEFQPKMDFGMRNFAIRGIETEQPDIENK